MAGVKGQSGRKAKPKVLKELMGTFREDRHNPNEPTLPALEKAPPCPAHLTGEIEKTWQQISELLTTMGVLTEVDLHALEAYCVVYTRWQDAESNLRTYGMMLQKGGSVFPSPYLRVAEDCLKQMRSWMNEFGITPSSRSRVKVEKPELVDEDEDWFAIRKN